MGLKGGHKSLNKSLSTLMLLDALIFPGTSRNTEEKRDRSHCKGPVINYGELGGGGTTKWENCESESFCTPPQDRVNIFRIPTSPLKGVKLFVPHYIMAQTSSSYVKTTSNSFVPAFSMAKHFSTPFPLFIGIKPPTLPLCSSPSP